MSARRDRGRETERLVAGYWRARGFPHAEVVRGAGRDLTGTGPVAPEIKARAAFEPLRWARQARRNADAGGVPCVILRCNGQGAAALDDWPVMLPHSVFLRLLGEAGYAGVGDVGALR